MTDEQLLEYRRVKLLERDKQVSKLIAENSKLREGLREGISLRDHFAGLAMQGLVGKDESRDANYEEDAEHYYFIADTMLAEREKRDV
jgi:hypothetical protein